MITARDKWGEPVCARCGAHGPLTKDHFMPRSLRMDLDRDCNYVGLCLDCNRAKKDAIVLPTWYSYLSDEQRMQLNRYMRYCRSSIREKCTTPEILAYIEKL